MGNTSTDFYNELGETYNYIVVEAIPCISDVEIKTLVYESYGSGEGVSGTIINKVVYDTLPEYVETLPEAINHWVWYENGWKRVIH